MVSIAIVSIASDAHLLHVRDTLCLRGARRGHAGCADAEVRARAAPAARRAPAGGGGGGGRRLSWGAQPVGVERREISTRSAHYLGSPVQASLEPPRRPPNGPVAEQSLAPSANTARRLRGLCKVHGQSTPGVQAVPHAVPHALPHAVPHAVVQARSQAVLQAVPQAVALPRGQLEAQLRHAAWRRRRPEAA